MEFGFMKGYDLSEFRLLAHFGTRAIGPVPMPTPHTLCHSFSGGASLTHWFYFFFYS